MCLSQTRVIKELIRVVLTDEDDSWYKCLTQVDKKDPHVLGWMKDYISQQPLGQSRVSSPSQVTFAHWFRAFNQPNVRVCGGNRRTWGKCTAGDPGIEPQTFLVWGDRANRHVDLIHQMFDTFHKCHIRRGIRVGGKSGLVKVPNGRWTSLIVSFKCDNLSSHTIFLKHTCPHRFSRLFQLS